MARKKKEQPPANTEGWLNTYADMVTLLLCFFVMMYTASTPDEQKMQWIFQSFQNFSGSILNPVVMEPVDDSRVDNPEDNPGPDKPPSSEGDMLGVAGVMPKTYDDLFNWVSQAISENDLSSAVSVSVGEDGKLHIRFDSDIMFAGNSYELLPAGRNALNKISPGINAIQDYIASVNVEGHTAPTPGDPKVGVNEWFLSSLRSVSVVNHLDFDRRMVASEKFKTNGIGRYDPYYPVDTEATNSKNRRVELVITRNDFNLQDTEVMMDLLKYDFGLPFNSGGQDISRYYNPQEFDKKGQVGRRILEKYGDIESVEIENDLPIGEWGVSIPGIPVISPKDDAEGNVDGADNGDSAPDGGADE